MKWKDEINVERASPRCVYLDWILKSLKWENRVSGNDEGHKLYSLYTERKNILITPLLFDTSQNNPSSSLSRANIQREPALVYMCLMQTEPTRERESLVVRWRSCPSGPLIRSLLCSRVAHLFFSAGPLPASRTVRSRAGDYIQIKCAASRRQSELASLQGCNVRPPI